MKNDSKTPQQLYVQKQKRSKWIVWIVRLLLLAGLLVLWETASANGWIDSFIFSSPSAVAACFRDMWTDGTLQGHLLVTLWEVLLSFAITMAISLAMALLLWWGDHISKILEPYLVVLNSLPKTAMAPLLIVWLGANMKTIIVAGISVAVFGSILNLYTGFCETDGEELKLIRTLGGGRFHMMTKVILPGNLPLLISLMKVNVGLCLVGVMIGEFLAADKGLGYLIIYSSQVFKMTWLLMAIVVLCVIAFLLYELIAGAEHLFLRRR